MADYTVRIATMYDNYTVPVTSLDEASRIISRYVDRMGASHGKGVSGTLPGFGDVVSPTGRAVARVSYNGRVWPPGKWKPGIESIEGAKLTKVLGAPATRKKNPTATWKRSDHGPTRTEGAWSLYIQRRSRRGLGLGERAAKPYYVLVQAPRGATVGGFHTATVGEFASVAEAKAAGNTWFETGRLPTKSNPRAPRIKNPVTTPQIKKRAFMLGNTHRFAEQANHLARMCEIEDQFDAWIKTLTPAQRKAANAEWTRARWQ